MNKLLGLAIVCLCLQGCSATKMYDGEGRTKNEIVLVHGMNPLDPLIPSGFAAEVLSVDGKIVPKGKGYKVSLLPGEHIIKVSCKRPGKREVSDTITKRMEAGEEWGIGPLMKKVGCGFIRRK